MVFLQSPAFSAPSLLSSPSSLTGMGILTWTSKTSAPPCGIIDGATVAKTTGSFPFFLRVANTNNTGRDMSLSINLIQNGDMKADRNGARQVSSVWSCNVWPHCSFCAAQIVEISLAEAFYFHKAWWVQIPPVTIFIISWRIFLMDQQCANTVGRWGDERLPVFCLGCLTLHSMHCTFI